MPSDDHFGYLKESFRRGRFLLFTGAGFSLSAFDVLGSKLPSGYALARELWEICYPDDDFDETTRLQDIFHASLRKKRNRSIEHIRNRFSVDLKLLPDFYRPWLSMPWKRIYTLNIDNLTTASCRKWDLPRDIVSYSCIGDRARIPGTLPTGLSCECVHLNGVLDDIPDGVTFSDTQYADRLARQDPAYEILVTDILTSPVIFVGTPIDESPFWQHLAMRGPRGERGVREHRPGSFLVSPSLNKARQEVLKEFNIEWIQATAEEFSENYLAPLVGRVDQGFAYLRSNGSEKADAEDCLSFVSELASAPLRKKSQYLLGAEPEWDDIQSGRAIVRQVYTHILRIVERENDGFKARKSGGAEHPGSLLTITGTACTGKSTALKRIALHLNSLGKTVGWVDCGTDISPRTIQRSCHGSDKPEVLCIDDADRYGSALSGMVRDLLYEDGIEQVIVAMRSSKVDTALNPSMTGDLVISEVAMPNMEDGDIEGLIAVLDKDNLLGNLTAEPHDVRVSAFANKAGRQLLVAMIEATTGYRFEEKVADEWRELGTIKKRLYAFVAVATALRFPIKRQLILLATEEKKNAVVDALEQLVGRNIFAETKSGEIRARHRRIAEVLLDDLQKEGYLVPEIFSKITRAATYNVSPSMNRRAKPWRMLISLLNHDYLFRSLGLEGARTVYENVEDRLSDDHHYWLQRGSLELEEGNIQDAERYLNTAKSIEPGDPFLTTAFAYMLIKSAYTNPLSAGATRRAEEGEDLLRNQIAARGGKDRYPFHVLGSQMMSWVAKSPLGKEEKKKVLKRVLETIHLGVEKHPRKKELFKLEKDVQRQLLQLEVVRS